MVFASIPSPRDSTSSRVEAHLMPSPSLPHYSSRGNQPYSCHGPIILVLPSPLPLESSAPPPSFRYVVLVVVLVFPAPSLRITACFSRLSAPQPTGTGNNQRSRASVSNRRLGLLVHQGREVGFQVEFGVHWVLVDCVVKTRLVSGAVCHGRHICARSCKQARKHASTQAGSSSPGHPAGRARCTAGQHVGAHGMTGRGHNTHVLRSWTWRRAAWTLRTPPWPSLSARAGARTRASRRWPSVLR